MDTHIDHRAYSDGVKTYLSNKYHENFTVETVYREFSGDTGNFIRLQCKGTSSDEIFTVRCYLDPQVTPQILKIDGKDHSVEDNYAEILCQKQFAELFAASDNENCVVKCKIDFYGRQPTVEEFSQGLQACLKNEALRSYMKIYILSDGNANALRLYEYAEQLAADYAPDTAYIYFAVPETFDVATADRLYADNRDNFGNYLANKSYAKQLWFTLYETGSGLKERKLIKE